MVKCLTFFLNAIHSNNMLRKGLHKAYFYHEVTTPIVPVLTDLVVGIETGCSNKTLKINLKLYTVFAY